MGSGGSGALVGPLGEAAGLTHACALPCMCLRSVWAPMPCIRSRGRTSQSSYFGRRERQHRMHPSQLMLALSLTRPCASAAHASVYAYGRHDREENGHRRKERPRTTGPVQRVRVQRLTARSTRAIIFACHRLRGAAHAVVALNTRMPVEKRKRGRRRGAQAWSTQRRAAHRAMHTCRGRRVVAAAYA